MDLNCYIRDYQDFPVSGVNFKDINPLLGSGEAWLEVITQLEEFCKETKPDIIVGIESRGFIIGASLSTALGIGFIPIRKD